MILMTQRRRLDAFLAEQATAAGVEFRDGAAVSGSARPTKPLPRVVGRSRIDASYVVGADGANGIVARRFGLRSRRHSVEAALEGNVGWGTLDPEPYRGTTSGRARRRSGRLRAGSFQKGDHRTSVGGWLQRGRSPGPPGPACPRDGVDAEGLTEILGHRLPMRPSARPPVAVVLVVGDAAGLVDPLCRRHLRDLVSGARLEAFSRDGPEGTRRVKGRSIAAQPPRGRPNGSRLASSSESPGGAGAWSLRRGGGAPARRPCASERGEWGLARPPLRALARLARMTPSGSLT